MPAAQAGPGGWAGIHCWPSCHPSSSSSPLCLVDTDVSQLFQASSHSPFLAQDQSFPRNSSSTKAFSTEWQCWLVGQGVPAPLENQSGFSAGTQTLSELSYQVAHANRLSLLPHELGCFMGTCFCRRPLCHHRCGSSRCRLSSSSSSQCWEDTHQHYQLLWQKEGASPCPHPHRHHKQIPFLGGIQFRIAAWAWSPLPGSCQAGSLSLAMPAPSALHSCCQAVPLLLSPPLHPAHPGEHLWLSLVPACLQLQTSMQRSGSSQILQHHCNCRYYFGLTWQAKGSRRFAVFLDNTTLYT